MGLLGLSKPPATNSILLKADEGPWMASLSSNHLSLLIQRFTSIAYRVAQAGCHRDKSLLFLAATLNLDGLQQQRAGPS